MRCCEMSHNCSNGCGKYIVNLFHTERVRELTPRRPDFSFHGDSPSNEHLTHRFLLRYYLLKVDYITDI